MDDNKKLIINGETVTVQCVFCGKNIELLEKFNGEMACESCYNDQENEVFSK